jgi:hypothetical protein
MMKYTKAAAVVLASLGLTLAAAGPARAGGAGGPITPPTATGGCQGATCNVGLGQVITLSGDTGGHGGSFEPIDQPLPPCFYAPIGDQIAGSNLVIAVAAAIDVGVTIPGLIPPDLGPYIQQAEALLKNPVPGEWYDLDINPADTMAQAIGCNALPPFQFVQAGNPPPAQPIIPPEIIARFAYNHFTIPQPRLTISPVGKGVVNLGTYVWARWPISPTTGQEDVYQVKAQLGNTVVTVQARAQSVSPTQVPRAGSLFTDCGPHGSRFPVSSPPATAGAGTPPDCGVLWRGPDASASISATATWTVTWWANDGVVHNLPDIKILSRPTNIAVSEIQGINGGQ